MVVSFSTGLKWVQNKEKSADAGVLRFGVRKWDDQGLIRMMDNERHVTWNTTLDFSSR